MAWLCFLDTSKYFYLSRSMYPHWHTLGESAKKQHEITTLMGEVQKLTSKLRQVSIDIRDAEAVIVTLDQHRPHVRV